MDADPSKNSPRHAGARRVAAALGALAPTATVPAAEPVVPLGLTVASCGLRLRQQPASSLHPPFRDALDLLRHARELGGAGAQVSVAQWSPDFAAQLRQFAEAHHLYLEGQIRLPNDEADLDRFNRELRVAREAGVRIFRTVALGTRRYETFESREAFDSFKQRAWKSIRLAESAVRKLGLRLALENHKDWRIPELLELLRQLPSEHLGICLDTGNSLSLLEDSMEVVRAYAPYAFTTHLKDMAMQEFNDGFLLSEVPLGEGFLDLPEMIAILRRARPEIRLNLEMITRDPLLVPCLTKKYFATMPDLPASTLAGALQRVHAHPPQKPLPRITGLALDQQLELEEAHNRRSFQWAQAIR